MLERNEGRQPQKKTSIKCKFLEIKGWFINYLKAKFFIISVGLRGISMKEQREPGVLI